MKGKKLFALLLSSALLLGAVAGCSSPAPSGSAAGSSQQPSASTAPEASKPAQAEQQPCTITYYGGWTGADLDRMSALVDEFNKSQDKITVEFTSLQWSEIFTKFLADYQAGSSPDVVAMHTFEMGQFVNMGVLDSESVAAMNLNEADYAKVAWDGCTYDGKLYGVPIDINMHALYYNKDLFAKAGIEKAPSTGEELIAAAQKLTLDANGKNAADPNFDANSIKQYGFGFLQNHHGFYQTYGMMNQMGYNPFTADATSISLDAAKITPALQFVEDLIYKYHVTPVGEKSPIDDFKAGNVAMIIDGNWQLSGFSQVTFDWDTAEYPQIFDQKAVWGASELLAFPGSKNPDANKQLAARTFVQWLAENSAKWAESGQIPANVKSQEASAKLHGIDAYYAELDYVKFLPAHPKAVELFSSKAPSPILTMAQDACLNNKAPADIVTQFEKDLNTVLSK